MILSDKITIRTRRDELVTVESNSFLEQQVRFDGTRLVAFTYKNKQFEIPTTHLGQPLADQLPETVGRLALNYIRSQSDEAFLMAEEGD